MHAVLEYKDVLPKMLEVLESKKGRSVTGCLEHPDNRHVWAELLRSDFRVPAAQPGRSDNLSCIRTLVRIYITVLDGECQVERDLGRMSAEVEEHCNVHGTGINDLMLLLSRGPRTRDDWEHDSHSTAFARQCVAYWRKHVGARLGIGGGKRRPATEKKTWKRVHLRVGSAAKAVVRANKAGLTARPAVNTLFGDLKREDLRATPGRPASLFTDKHLKFQRDTTKKKVAAAARLHVLLQGKGLQPRLQEIRAAPVQSEHPLQTVEKVCFAEFAAGDVPKPGSYQVCSARHADLVVVPDLSVLVEPQDSFLPTLCFIVLCGLPVVTKQLWEKARARTCAIPAGLVVSHSPGAAKGKLFMTPALAAEHGAIAKALAKACERHGKLTLKFGLTDPPVAGRSFSSVADVCLRLISQRRVVNFAKRPRVLAADGQTLL